MNRSPTSKRGYMDRKTVEGLAGRYAVSEDAVRALWEALQKGNGAFAQFNHAELGGMGQWSSGGMIMIGDMFNTQLKDRVNALSTELAAFLRADPSEIGSRPLLTPDHSDAWWGTGLGHVAASGSQNDMRYAYFPSTRRLAIQNGDNVTVYDTGEHQIHGVAQKQSSSSSLSFVSQLGIVRVETLPILEKRR
jgi:hypothetical protein